MAAIALALQAKALIREAWSNMQRQQHGAWQAMAYSNTVLSKPEILKIITHDAQA